MSTIMSPPSRSRLFLPGLALVTLGLKTFLEWRHADALSGRAAAATEARKRGLRHSHRGSRAGFRRLSGVARRQPRHCARRTRRAARPLGLRQDDAAARDRGPQLARSRRGSLRRRERDQSPRAGAPCRLRFPELRAVQTYDRRRQYRLRSEECVRDARVPRGRRSRRASRSFCNSCSSTGLAAAIRRSSPAASASASRSRARSPSSRACCCSTSPLARLTRACARICAAGCATFTSRPD